MADSQVKLADLRVRDAMRTKFPTVTPDQPCSKAMVHFAEDREPALVVIDDKGRYVGILGERDVLRSHTDPSQMTVEHALHALPTLDAADALLEASRVLLTSNARGLAVLGDNDRVEGLLVVEDVLRAASTSELADERIDQYMTRQLHHLDGGATVGQALALFRKEGFSRVPVTERGHVEGMVTVHDIVTDVIGPFDRAQGQHRGKAPALGPLAVELREVMSSPVVKAGESASYRDVVELFLENHAGSVLIGEDGQPPRGIVTRRDLLEPLAVLAQPVPTLVVEFSSKDASRDAFESSGAPGEVRGFLERYQKRIEPGLLHIHLKKHKDRNRGLELWHVRLNLTCNMGKFYAVGEGWGMQNATRLGVEHLEREVRREKEERLQRPSREFIEDMLY